MGEDQKQRFEKKWREPNEKMQRANILQFGVKPGLTEETPQMLEM